VALLPASSGEEVPGQNQMTIVLGFANDLARRLP
jgi:hypothetical protein